MVDGCVGAEVSHTRAGLERCAASRLTHRVCLGSPGLAPSPLRLDATWCDRCAIFRPGSRQPARTFFRVPLNSLEKLLISYDSTGDSFCRRANFRGHSPGGRRLACGHPEKAKNASAQLQRPHTRPRGRAWLCGEELKNCGENVNGCDRAHPRCGTRSTRRMLRRA
jgi:hypothetical protein